MRCIPPLKVLRLLLSLYTDMSFLYRDLCIVSYYIYILIGDLGDSPSSCHSCFALVFNAML